MIYIYRFSFIIINSLSIVLSLKIPDVHHIFFQNSIYENVLKFKLKQIMFISYDGKSWLGPPGSCFTSNLGRVLVLELFHTVTLADR